MKGNGELTETENVIFLRKLRSFYGILTDERNSYVLCYENGYGNGYGTLDIRHQTDNACSVCGSAHIGNRVPKKKPARRDI